MTWASKSETVWEGIESERDRLLGAWRCANSAATTGTKEEEALYEREARKAEERFERALAWLVKHS